MLNPVAINSRLLLAAIVGLAVMLSRPVTAEDKQAEWRAGLASVCITPEGPIPMCGYNPWMSEGVLDDLYAKAMAIEDAEGGRAVLLTADLLFFRAPMAEAICREIMEKTGLERRQILLNASHTHSGPVFGIKDPDRFELTKDQRATVDAYTKKLQGQLVRLVEQALADMKPARFRFGTGKVDFVMNRRLMGPDGKCRGMGPNPQGPVDRSVPVLRVDAPDGSLRALLFGCACHNVTLDGANRKISGDYASFAQQVIQRQHPGAQAMFMIGCGGDANSHPRGGPEQERLVREHGESLGKEVCRVAAGELQPVVGPLRAELRWTDLPLEHELSREQLQQIVKNQPSYWHARNAQGMLDTLNRNEPLPTDYRAAIALWQFGRSLTLVGLPGEAVAEYASQLRQVLGEDRLWIAAYTNESFGYLPTAKMLAEGGHESMCLTLAIGFFSPQVEEVVLNTVRELAEKAGREEARAAGAPYPVRIEKNVRIPMRDGVTLAADVYRPDAGGRFPALVQLSYYVTGPGIAAQLAPRGYACVLANSRGRGGSEGEWDPYVNEPRDGFDTQEWAGRQPWCTGKVGMFGQSYNAFTQIMSAPLANPHLACILPIEGQQSFFGHQYNDGVLQLNVVFTHGLFATGATGLQGHIPIRDPHFLTLPLMSAADRVPHPQAQRIKLWMQHARYDDHWKSFGVKDKYDRIQAPAYFVTGWYDNLVHENFRNFEGFRQQGGSQTVRRGTRLRVGPGVHGANRLPQTEHLRWYDYWLKGLPTGIDKEAPLRIFVMGAGKWRDEYEWPLARTQFTKFYLHSGGRANSVRGDGRLTTSPPAAGAPEDTFVYDPANPVYTLGGQISTNPEVWGPQDRQSVQTREDVLVYTTQPLAEDTEVTGPVELRLFAASTAVDTDFTATLTDVDPEGRAIHICEGIRGVTFRESLENPTPIEPGRVYEYSISLWETSQVFAKGHRIRLEVSSSNFPRYARNQNTGLPLGTSAEIKTASQTIFHDAERPSHLILPLIPAEHAGAIRPRADGSLRLTADRAKVEGGALKLAADAGILGWWTDPDSRATWSAGVERAGSYRVALTFACDDKAAGNQFQITAGRARLTGTVPSTGTWHDQREHAFGELQLESGVQLVVVRSLGPIRGALFDLRAVDLLPVAATSAGAGSR